MTPFDTVLVVDWSGGNDTGPRETSDAIWTAVVRGAEEEAPLYHQNRLKAESWIAEFLASEMAEGHRLLAGFDFAFGFPTGIAKKITGSDDPLTLWDWFARELDDGPKGNNRFELAARINGLFPGTGPFWFNGTKTEFPGLPRRRADRSAEYDTDLRRETEARASGTFTCWQMGGAGAVGGQAFTGMATLARLRAAFAGRLSVWPFEAPDTEIVFAEVYPSLLRDQVRATLATGPDQIKDAVQVRLLARALARLGAEGRLGAAFSAAQGPSDEGWILGVGVEERLQVAARPDIRPPRLKDDCFALPPGVDWVPVDDALERLRGALSPVVDQETIPVAEASGRILAKDHIAQRSNPPLPNSAVDGYGFAHSATGAGPQLLPLVPGRAAAGAVFQGTVPEGRAIRILTGASLPDGVDTVVLEEDVTLSDGHVAFDGPVKPGANTRRAGEDVTKGDVALASGHAIRPPDMALLSALGLGQATVFGRLRVGVLSTGDELAEPGTPDDPSRVYDANRPMLLSLVRGWGYAETDLGIARDTRDTVRKALDDAASRCDAILTSGGASAGDEDHISAILRDEGKVQTWRIALKPGRPLMLGQWNGVPVFGMPGNPVAALVCALIFARPALSVLAGGRWEQPDLITVPAAFTKRKKAGRREYLRARLDTNGHAEVFASEGSGRISGLSWATGLVELDDGARDIEPGDPVRFIPYAALGLV